MMPTAQQQVVRLIAMTLLEQYRALIAYLNVKAAIGDWHGVRVAANDLCELEAKYPELIQPGKGHE